MIWGLHDETEPCRNRIYPRKCQPLNLLPEKEAWLPSYKVADEQSFEDEIKCQIQLPHVIFKWVHYHFRGSALLVFSRHWHTLFCCCFLCVLPAGGGFQTWLAENRLVHPLCRHCQWTFILNNYTQTAIQAIFFLVVGCCVSMLPTERLSHTFQTEQVGSQRVERPPGVLKKKNPKTTLRSTLTKKRVLTGVQSCDIKMATIKSHYSGHNWSHDFKQVGARRCPQPLFLNRGIFK